MHAKRPIAAPALALILGMLPGSDDCALAQGFQLQSFVTSAWVHSVPEPPGGGSWDSAFEFKGIAPDIFICVKSPVYPRVSCTAYCPNQYECNQPFADPPYGVPLDPQGRSLTAYVYEYSPSRNRLIGELDDIEPARCTDAVPCTKTFPEGEFSISFGVHIRQVQTPRAAPPPSASTSTEPPADSSWLDPVNQWFRDWGWQKVVEECGAPCKFLEGLKGRGDARDAAYRQCLLDGLKANSLTPRLDTVCAGKTDRELEQCAARVLGEARPDTVAFCVQKEGQVGFLAGLWKAGCNVLGLTCN